MSLKQEVARQMEIIRRGAAEIISEEELEQKIEFSITNQKPLNVKLGLDPSAPDIHLGHTVVLHKMKQFQDLGHKIIIIIGDFTGRIGDPSGKSETRKQLSEEEILLNAKTYQDQIFKILDQEKTTITFNSEWLAPLNFQQVIELAAKTTVARILERDDFAKRYQENLPLGLHEFFYPLMQAYDSVSLAADVELGGTDQKFNLLMGRTLQREYGQKPQIAITMPILEGLDGVQKMSKSLGNYIGISEDPKEMYGKTMSIADDLMLRYFELVTTITIADLAEMKEGLEQGKIHPRDLKMRLAREIVTFYHSEKAALEAENDFKRVFQKGELPAEIPVYQLDYNELEDGGIWLPKLLVLTGLLNSTSEARRQVIQGAVKINAEKIIDPKAVIKPEVDMVIQVGKRKYIQIK